MKLQGVGKIARQILHADMDAFYAAVELLDEPGLQGHPVIVGGDMQRGVVSSCCYQARSYGVHSAQPLAVARRLCPQAVIRPVRMARYRQISAQVMAIFADFTDRVEALSIDEAFLDVTGCERLFGSARQIAETIRSRVRSELGLVISIGIAPNKFLAKLASQQAKPDGLLAVSSDDVAAFLNPLPVAALWGVGKATQSRLQALGIATVDDLLRYPAAGLERQFGKSGRKLLRLARGEDERAVETEAEIKSVSNEKTFAVDILDGELIARETRALVEKVAERLRDYGLRGREITLKLRYDDFTTVNRSCTLAEASDHGRILWSHVQGLLGRTEAGTRPVRLVGVGVAGWEDPEAGQQRLFGEPAEERRNRALDRAVDSLNRRYGRGRICQGSLLPLSRQGVEEGGDAEE